MQAFGIDYAWGRPSIPGLHASGVKFVGRYLSGGGNGKDLTRGEYGELRRAGIDVIAVWETSANRALDGFTAGQSDARAARSQAASCGLSTEHALFFAVDFEANGTEIHEYFRGVNSVLAHRAGAYGGLATIQYLFDKGLIHYGWQTYAWSGGKWDRRAGVRQYSNDHTLAGVSCDYDVAIAADFGQGVPPKPAPSPLDVLLPAERAIANNLLKTNKRIHPLKWRRYHNELVRKRQEVWNAAVRGIDPNGRRVGKGWKPVSRINRYLELKRLTA